MENKDVKLMDKELDSATGGVCQLPPEGEMPGGHCKCGGTLLFDSWYASTTIGITVCDSCGTKWSFKNM